MAIAILEQCDGVWLLLQVYNRYNWKKKKKIYKNKTQIQTKPNVSVCSASNKYKNPVGLHPCSETQTLPASDLRQM